MLPSMALGMAFFQMNIRAFFLILVVPGKKGHQTFSGDYEQSTHQASLITVSGFFFFFFLFFFEGVGGVSSH